MARAIAAEPRKRVETLTNAADAIASRASSGFCEWRRADPFGYSFFFVWVFSLLRFSVCTREIQIPENRDSANANTTTPTFFSSRVERGVFTHRNFLPAASRFGPTRLGSIRLARGSRTVLDEPGLGSQKVFGPRIRPISRNFRGAASPLDEAADLEGEHHTRIPRSPRSTDRQPWVPDPATARTPGRWVPRTSPTTRRRLSGSAP